MEWEAEEIFWEINLKRAPMSARANANYANILIKKDDLKGAKDLMVKAVSYNPEEKKFQLGLDLINRKIKEKN